MIDIHIRFIAEEAARLLLQHFGQAHPDWHDEQTPLHAIAEWLGLDIATFHAADYPKGTYGFIDPDEGENLIWLLRDMSETFRRFTLAHEIGHVVLHCHHQHIAPMLSSLATQLAALEAEQHVPDVSREDPCHDNDVREELTGLAEQSLDAVGIGISYDPRSQREIMANIFAAELLMPLAQVRSLYLEQQVPPHTLATRFAVSNAAILNRLASLVKASDTLAKGAMNCAPTEGVGVGAMNCAATEGVGVGAMNCAATNDTSIPSVGAQFIAPAPKQYDEFQQAAIEALTPALIVAGPGSGKTSTLIGRIEYLLSTLHIPPQHILALTFSRKAAKEMEERLQKMRGESAPLPKVSTFHAFCADLLRQHGTRVGLRADFALIDEAEGYFLLRQQANKMKLRHYMKLQAPTYYFPELLKAISRAKDELISPQEYARLAQQMQASAHDEEAIEEAEKALEVAHVYALYEQALLKRGDTDFGGLLVLAVQLLRRCPDVWQEQQQKYQQVLVDEFQDVNRASGILLRELAGEGQRVWVVGDANQCQPAGTMIRLPDGSECPIEQIQPNSKVVTYDRDSTMFVKKGQVTDVAVRPYQGMLYTVKVNDKQTRCTDSHKWLVRWTNTEQERWVTYLMRQGDRYRVGQTQLFLKPKLGKSKKNGDLRLALRVCQEKADAAWILKVHDTLADALVYEQILSVKYGLPEVVFTQSYGVKCFSQEMIDKIYNSLLLLEDAARCCLIDHGRKLEYPLFTRKGMNGVQNEKRQKQGRTTIFETQTCNLITGFMAIPVAPTHIHSKRDHSIRRVVAESWKPVEVTCEPFSGPVYSLNIAKYHKYIADGLVTCNSIYSFRGASPANISQFKTDFPGAVVLPLSRNYRSRPDLVALAEAFRCRQLELGQEPGKNYPVRLTHPDTYISLAKAADERSELAGLVQDIYTKYRHGYAYKDMVVLCRTRASVQKVTRVLTTAGLPVIERNSLLEQEHIKDLLALISLLIDPCAMGLLRAAQQPAHPLAQTDIETLLLSAQESKTSPRSLLLTGEWPQTISSEGQSSLQRLSNILQTFQRTLTIWSLLAQYMLIETPLLRNLLRHRADEHNATLLADYDALLQLARHYDAQQQARTRSAGQPEDEQNESATPSIEEQVKGFLEYLTILVMLRQDGNRAGNDENEQEQADVIRVMTVHASKGLEFPVVYLPGLLQRRFPAQARSSPITAPTGMSPEESVGHASHESGEACLFYVAVTRARDQLVLSYSERYGKQKYKRSPYLDALEAGSSDERISKIEWRSDHQDEQHSNEQPVQQSSLPSNYFMQRMKDPTLHAKDIEAYQRCPRAYLYSTIYRFTGQKNAYQLFWQATQKTVEVLHKQAGEPNSAQQQPPTPQELRELYTQHWQAAGGHTEPFADLYEAHGHEVVEAAQRDLSLHEKTDWYLRQRFAVDIAGQQIHVTVDRTETSQQVPAKFVRTRFGRRKDKPPAETRELLYKLAYQQQHPGQEVELHSHNMSTGEVMPIKMTAKKEQNLYDAVEQSVAGLVRDEYPAAPAEPLRCPGCPFFWICPA